MRRFFAVVCMLLGQLSLPSITRGDTGLTEAALAERLFEEGKAAMEAKRYGVACEKLAASQRVQPGGGTALLLALCLEAQSKFASAWTAYQAALGYARRDSRQDRIDRALERIAAVEPRISRLYVRLSRELRNDIDVFVDGTRMPSTAFDSGLPVDPGSHEVRAVRAGAQPWSTRVEAVEGQRRVYVDVPSLAPRRRPVAAPRSRDQQGWSRRDSAMLLFATGSAAIVSGLVAGGIALARDRKANDLCSGVECTNRHAVDQNAQARSAATAATVAFGIGLAFGAAGGVVFFTSEGGS